MIARQDFNLKLYLVFNTVLKFLILLDISVEQIYFLLPPMLWTVVNKVTYIAFLFAGFIVIWDMCTGRYYFSIPNCILLFVACCFIAVSCFVNLTLGFGELNWTVHLIVYCFLLGQFNHDIVKKDIELQFLACSLIIQFVILATEILAWLYFINKELLWVSNEYVGYGFSGLSAGNGKNKFASDALLFIILSAIQIVSRWHRKGAVELLYRIMNIVFLALGYLSLTFSQSKTSQIVLILFSMLFFLGLEYGKRDATKRNIYLLFFIAILIGVIVFCGYSLIFNCLSPKLLHDSERVIQDSKLVNLRLVDDEVDFSVTGRTEIWRESLKLIKQKPIFGHGCQNLTPVEYYGKELRIPHIKGYTHNAVLWLAVFFGIPAALLISVYIGLINLKLFLKLIKKRNGIAEYGWFLFANNMCWIIFSMVECGIFFFNTFVSIFFFIALGYTSYYVNRE
jgi:O-antigen ligase